MTEAYPRPRPQAVTGEWGASRRKAPCLPPLAGAWIYTLWTLPFARQDKPKPFTSKLYSDFDASEL
jgi:hypothetical protein